MISGIDPLTATAADLQATLTSNSVTSRQLVKLYLDRIGRYDGYFRAVIVTAPEDLLDKAATRLDGERTNGHIRGPLHGIPILIKLVAAGAIIIGKANLSVCANLKSDLISLTFEDLIMPTADGLLFVARRNPHTFGEVFNAGGSSSGSAVAVAAGLSPISIGTETMGSLIMPSDRSALYTIKPTLKIISQEGLIPVTYEADSAGPMTKSVLDLANLLDILVDPSKTSVPEGGYRSAVTGKWGDIRIGVVEPADWLFPTKIVKYEQQASDQMLREWELAYEKLRTVAKTVKPVKLLSLEEATLGGTKNIWTAFASTFKDSLEDYLGSIDNSKVRTLEDLIKFNEEHAEQELPPSADNQAGFIRALHAKMPDDEYRELIDFARDRCGKNGIDKVLEENEVDIIIGPGDGPMINIAGTAGYPSATLPLGYLDFNGRPFGLQILAKAHQEALLIEAQSAWEATFAKRQPPPLSEIIKLGEAIESSNS
ncbi:hypothetical protein GQX73_g2780 [Xylaria multiplex]|uniref:Amidase domain-containing protein n=1 Tax=Xylaria multiplex TaxID=323545 RepID=A0A7C8N1J0_9PEZI|nr:hypothetical protein GQX73_g2780 [Xylaria multiplex]